MAAVSIGLSSIGFPSHFYLGPHPPLHLRRTSPVVFNKRLTSEGSAGQNFLQALTTARDRLTAFLEREPPSDILTSLPPLITNYLSLLRGICVSNLTGDNPAFDSPLRTKCGRILWTHFTDGGSSSGIDDALFDMACVLTSAAVSLHLFASAQAMKKTDDETTRVAFRAISLALSYVGFVKDQLMPNIEGAPPVDMTQAGVGFLHSLLSAHAHEIIVGRAEAQGHDNLLISRLARFASEQFSLAGGKLSTILVGKPALSKILPPWMKYFEMKANLFHSIAYHRYALSLTLQKPPPYGEAVKSAESALELLQKSLSISAAYQKEAKPPLPPLPQDETTGRRIRKDVDT